VASLLAGVLAYVLFAILTRHLGPVEAAPVSVLWTWWGLSSAAISFPLQHWIAHTVADHNGFGTVRRAVLPLAATTLLATAVVGGVAWQLRDPLFHRDGWSFPALVAALTCGAFVMGLLRGLLTARRQFGLLAASLVGEHVIRVVPCAVLAALGVDDPAAYGLVIVAGSFAILLWPPLLRLPRTGDLEHRASMRALSSAAAGQLMAQIVLTSGPIVLAVQGGRPAQVTALFATLAVFRAPFLLTQGMVAPLTGRWTQLAAAGRHRELGRARLVLVVGALPGAGQGAAFGALLGEPVVQLVFGPGVEVGRPVAALVAAGSTVAVANIGAMVLAIALGRAHLAVWAWLAAGLTALVIVVGAGEAPATRTATAFAVAELVAFGVLAVGLWRSSIRAARSTAG
jgi:O-antigen/teichoic acid export membrane protein